MDFDMDRQRPQYVDCNQRNNEDGGKHSKNLWKKVFYNIAKYLYF